MVIRKNAFGMTYVVQEDESEWTSGKEEVRSKAQRERLLWRAESFFSVWLSMETFQSFAFALNYITIYIFPIVTTNRQSFKTWRTATGEVLPVCLNEFLSLYTRCGVISSYAPQYQPTPSFTTSVRFWDRRLWNP